MRLFLALVCVATLLASPAHADPVTNLIIAFNAWAGTASAAALFAVRIGFSLALSALSVALQGKPDGPRQAGIRTDSTTTGGDNPESFVLGRYATAGNMVAPPYSHPNSGGVPNEYLTYVIDISGVAGVTFERIMVAGEYVTDLQASSGDHDQEGMLEDVPGVGIDVPHLFLTWHDGSQTAADAYMLANYDSYPERPWAADMVGAGLTYAVVTFRYNRKLFNSLPGVRFEVQGIPLYDPRLDTTVGGSGPQRWNDTSTWAQTDNPVVMVYNILRGITLPGGRIWGGKASAEDLPLANWFAGMNECDVDVVLNEGGTERQYRAGIEIGVDESPASVIEELLKACSAEIVEFGGIFKVRVGPPALPIYFFSDDDIVSDVPQTLHPYPGLDGVHNAVHATHPSPEALWESRDAPPRYNATWEAEDGGRQLVAQVNLPAVPYDLQVQRLTKAWIEDERRFRRHSLTLPPEAAILEPLDTVGWTSARSGYTSKVFECSEVSDDQTTLLQNISVREREQGDFDWSTADEIAVTHPSTVYVVPDARSVPGFGLNAITLPDGGSNARRPALRIVWNASGLSETDVIEFEVELVADQSDVATGVVRDVSKGRKIVGAGILPSTAYRARAKMVSTQGSVWTAWASVTTGDVRLGNSDLDDTVQGTLTDAGQTTVDFDALTSGFSGTLVDLEVDALAAQQAALDSDAARIAAQGARDQAQVSATSADGSAIASAGSASAAQAAEIASGVSASAAQAAEVSAVARAAAVFPADFRDDGAFFSRSVIGLSPAALGSSYVASVAGIGPVSNLTGFQQLSPRGYVPAVPETSIEVAAWVRATVNNTVGGASEAIRLDLVRMNEDGTLHSYGSLTPAAGDLVVHDPLVVADGWVLLRGVYTVPASPAFALIRPRVYYGFTSGGSHADGTWQVKSYSVRDVTSELAAGGYASAAATSLTAAQASETAAGQSAAAAETSKVAAETAQAAASVSQTNAASSASSAAGSAATATSQKDLAVTARAGAEAAETAAAISEAASVSAKNDAETASAAAAFSRDVAARVQNGGECANPIFVEPTASPTADPTGFTLTEGSGTTIERKGTGGKYGACVEYDTGSSLSDSRPFILYNHTNAGGLSASDVEAVEIDFEVEMISGQWGSAHIMVNWWGATYNTRRVYLSDVITSRNGKIQRVTALLERPTGFVAGGTDVLRVIFYGNEDGNTTQGEEDHQARIHRFDYRVLSKSASALLSQQAIVDLEGNALASFVMRAKAGGAAGSVEVVAASDPSGAAASKVTMTADEIEFDGMAVLGGNAASDNFDGTFSANGKTVTDVGTTGFALTQNGDVVFNSLYVRDELIVRDFIQDEAVSDGAYDADTSPRTVGSDSALQMAVVSLGAVDYDQFWKIVFVGEHRGDGGGVRSSQLIWRTRTKTSGVWSAWSTISASSGNGSDVWEQKFFFHDFIGKFEDVEFEIQASVNAPFAQWTQNNIRRTHVIARSNPVK